MSSGWPDVPAATRARMMVRDQLDYLAWVSEAMAALGFHGGTELGEWRRRVQTAYGALVETMTPGHGDPFPPDVPPAQRPGAWPDVPSASIPGMTVRHQLVVVRHIASNSRGNRLFPHKPAEVLAWRGRVESAYEALDHGPALAMPETARTTPPPPDPSTPSGRAGRRAGARGAVRAAPKKGAARGAPAHPPKGRPASAAKSTSKSAAKGATRRRKDGREAAKGSAKTPPRGSAKASKGSPKPTPKAVPTSASQRARSTKTGAKAPRRR